MMKRSSIFALAIIGSTLTANPSFAQSGAKVIYGTDDRQEVADYGDAVFRDKAKSVAGMVRATDLRLQSADSRDRNDPNFIRSRSRDESTFLFNLDNTLRRSMNVCPEERFAEQPTLPMCTGFLVAPDVLVTAGHCVTSQAACRDFVWVFDYVEGTTEIPAENVYRCREVLSQRQTLGIFKKIDYAVVRLDRRSERAPLSYRRSGSASRGDEVLVIGHPSGLPMKIADNATITVTTPNTFRADLDTYGGNSGSPVFNTRTGLVEGVLVSGAQDYTLDRSRGCIVSERREPSRSRDSKERVHRITKIPGL
jgi:V8-like Glu-specific endopeptidase